MLPLLRKKIKGAAASQTPAWHPNFRNYERLPDVKVVRTVFFVNAAAITVALAVTTYFVHTEYKHFSLRGEIAATQAQIDQDKPGSDQAIASYKKFQDQDKKITEVEAFMKARPVLSDLIIHLGQTLPKNIALTHVEAREAGVSVRGIVRGASEQATVAASAYVDQLKGDKTIMMSFDEVTQISVTRTGEGGRVAIELYLKLKGAKK